MRGLALVSACAVALLSLAGLAQASTVTVSAVGAMRLDARAGEVNGVTLREATLARGWAYTVDDVAGLEVGRGCTRLSVTAAQCIIGQVSDPLLGARPIRRIVLSLGDRADSSDVFTFDGFASVDVRGGAGDDVLAGGPAVPSDGSYSVSGDAGADSIVGLATNGGAVDIDGGPGDDRVSTTGLIGEGSVRGGPGDDTFTIGAGVFATIDGGAGRDTITTLNPGAFIVPTVLGGRGDDTIDAAGASSIDCGQGLDRYRVYDGQASSRCEVPLP